MLSFDQLSELYANYNFKFNDSAIEKFLEKINESDKQISKICKKILDNTLYISFSKFVETLNAVINDYIDKYLDFHKTGRPIFIYNFEKNDQGNINKSNYWIYKYVLEYLKTNSLTKDIEIISIYGTYGKTPEQLNFEFKIEKDDIIILIDDCIYSGAQMGRIIKNFDNIKKHFKFYMLIPFGSLTAKNYIDYEFNKNLAPITIDSKRVKVSSVNLIFSDKMISFKKFTDVITDPDHIDLLNNYYPSNILNINDSYLIYFDHKLADIYSVPTIIYLGVIPNEKNRNCLFTKVRYIDDFQKLEENDLDIIPIINNCSTYVKDINLMSPKCPFPPYKEGFNSFIDNLKKLKISGGNNYLTKKRLLKSSKK